MYEVFMCMCDCVCVCVCVNRNVLLCTCMKSLCACVCVYVCVFVCALVTGKLTTDRISPSSQKGMLCQYFFFSIHDCMLTIFTAVSTV